MRFHLIALLSLLALTACDSTASLKELRHASLSADPYQASLAAEYQRYSEEKLAAYDWWGSKYFADKGLLAAYGRDIGPEDPALWNIPTGMQTDFAAAREQLMAAVIANRASNPEAAARAVVAYDRWVELQDKGWNAPRIEQARDHFISAMSDLTAPPEEAAVSPQPVESTSTVLYFPLDSDDLTDSAVAAIDELVSYIRSAGAVTVTINGHADRSGADNYNMALSERRARYVRRALEQAGIPESEIQYFAFGESDPAVATPDSVAEPKNRRVEIFLE